MQSNNKELISMKRFLLVNAVLTCFMVLSSSCDKLSGGTGKTDEEQGQTLQIDREKMYGCWQVIKAKFAEDAKMTAWPYEATYATFQENGIYEGEGYYGKGSGSYSIQGNVINVLIGGQPYVDYVVSEQKDNSATMCATFRSNGVKVWMECEKVDTPEVTPPDVITEETIFNNEANVKAAVLGMYHYAAVFAGYQFQIEQKILTGESSSITPASDDVANLWEAGYSCMSTTSWLIDLFRKECNDRIDWQQKYLPHLKVIRSYIYYNMAMLWGDIPLVTEENLEAAKTGLPRTAKATVYSKALDDIKIAKDEIRDFDNLGINVFSPISANLLASELYLTIGSTQNAANAAGLAGTPTTPIILSLVDYVDALTSNAWGIYVKEHPALLLAEANGTSQTLVEDWQKSEFAEFGYWAMLKRIGKATDVVGCYDWQLLLPIPQREIILNNKLTQNPGYGGANPIEPVTEVVLRLNLESGGGGTKSKIAPENITSIQDGEKVWVNGKVYEAENSTVTVEPAERYVVYYGLSSTEVGGDKNSSTLEFPESTEEYPNLTCGGVATDYVVDLKILTGMIKLTLIDAKDIDYVILSPNNKSTNIAGLMTFSLPDMTFTGCSKGTNAIKAYNYNGSNVFYYSIPPMELKGGFTIFIYDRSGKEVLTKSVNRDVSIHRANIVNLGSVSVENK